MALENIENMQAALPETGESVNQTAPIISLEAEHDGSVNLPEGFQLTQAGFSQSGPDLILTAADGTQIIINDYFTLDIPPQLISANDAKIGPELASRLVGPLAPGQVAQAIPTLVGEPIGQIETLSGTVTAIRSDGTQVELSEGDSVYQGDILESGADGSIGVVLADETTFSMAENGRMTLDDMVYDPASQEGSVSISVLSGVFTFMSGEIAKADPDAMTVSTPVATIGIRGTQVGVSFSEDQGMDLVLMEEGDGFVGEVVVSNDAGVQILNTANQGISVISASIAPPEPVQMTVDQVRESFGSALNSMPESHNVNTYGAEPDAAADEAAVEEEAQAEEELVEEDAVEEEIADEAAVEEDADEEVVEDAPLEIADSEEDSGEDLADLSLGEDGGDEAAAGEDGGDEDVSDMLNDFDTAAGGNDGGNGGDGGDGGGLFDDQDSGGDDDSGSTTFTSTTTNTTGTSTTTNTTGDTGGTTFGTTQTQTIVVSTNTSSSSSTTTTTTNDDEDTGTVDLVLIGSAANDTFTGGAGNDTIDGGAGFDTVQVTGNFSDYIIRYGSVILEDTRGIDGTDHLLNIEELIFADGTSLNIGNVTGGSTNTTGQVLTASSVAAASQTSVTPDLVEAVDPTVFGSADADNTVTQSVILSGGGGDDVLIGGSGDDVLMGGDADDTLIGGGGVDTAVFDGNLADYTITVGTDDIITVTNVDGDTDSLVDVEELLFADQSVTASNNAPEILIAGQFANTGDGGTTGTNVGNRENLYDGEGFRWDVREDGYISDGSDDAYDGGLELDFGVEGGSQSSFQGHDLFLQEDGRTLRTSIDIHDGIAASRELYVSEDEGFARFLDSFTNTTSEAIEVTVEVHSDFGSDGDTQILKTSSGDTYFDEDDNWLVSYDGDEHTAEDGGDPVLTHVFQGEDGEIISNYNHQDYDELEYNFTMTLEPGETRSLMHFAAQSDTRAQGIAKAEALINLEMGALDGLDPSQLSAVANWNVASGIAATEDTSLLLGDITIADTENGSIQVTLSVGEGILTITGDAGLDTIIGEGTDTVSFIGTLTTINAALANNVAYEPNPNFWGEDEMTITVDDFATSFSNNIVTKSVIINVEPVNDEAPIANADSATTDEDTEVTIDVLANDTDFDGDLLVVSSVSQGANGEVTINEDGAISYLPNENHNGSDSFTYVVSDGMGGFDTQTATVTIDPVNDAAEVLVIGASTGDPQLLTDVSMTGGYNNSGPSAQEILRTDFGYGPNVDVGNDALPWVSINGYISTNNEVDYYSFNLEAGETIYLDIDYGMNQGDSFDPTLAFFNSSGTRLTYDDDTSTSYGGGGSIHNYDSYISYTVSSAGVYTAGVASYSNFPGFYGGSGGGSTGDYVLNVSLDPTGPVGSHQLEAVEDTSLLLSELTIADADAGNADISVTLSVENGILTGGAGLDVFASETFGDGVYSVNLTGTQADINAALTSNIAYEPDLNFNGDDTLTISIDDGGASGSGGAQVSTTEVTIAVAPANDAPTAGGDTYAINEDTTITFSQADLLQSAFDLDGDNLVVGDGGVTFTTSTMYIMEEGSDSIVSISSDGVRAEVVTQEQIMSVTGETNADMDNRGIALDSEGNLFFSELTSDAILMKPADGGDLVMVASRSDIMAATGTNYANPKSLAVGSDGMLYVSDDASDSLLQIDPTTGTVTNFVSEATLLTLPGIASIELDGGIVAAPDGTLYVSSAGSPDTVFAIDQATGDASILASGSPFSNLDVYMTLAPNGDLIVADDTNADTIHRIVTSGADAGTVTTFLSESQIEAVTGGDVNLEGGIGFDAIGNFYISDENDDAIYQWSGYDGGDGTIDPASGGLYVSQNQLIETSGGNPDLEGGMVFLNTSQNVAANADGSYTYTPPENFSGQVTLQYNVSDGTATQTATSTIAIAPVNDAPVAVDDTILTNITDGSPLTIAASTLLANDSDAEGDAFSIDTVATDWVSASVATDGNGDVVLTPPAFDGSQGSFTYSPSDGNLTGEAAVVNVIGVTGDTIDGTSADEILIGGSGADILIGGSGADILNGYTGDDQLTGGDGADIFSFGSGDGNDSILDFEIGDTVMLKGFLLEDVGVSLTLTNDGIGNVTITDSASDLTVSLHIDASSTLSVDEQGGDLVITETPPLA